jgi:hypothetical protein
VPSCRYFLMAWRAKGAALSQKDRRGALQFDNRRGGKGYAGNRKAMDVTRFLANEMNGQ